MKARMYVWLLVGLLVLGGSVYLASASDTFVQVPTGEKIDASGLTVGGNSVQRQRMVMADPNAAGGQASVLNTQPAVSEYGVTVRPITRGNTATVTRVSDTATSTILDTATSGRISLTIVNDASTTLFILKGSGTASATNYTYRLNQYETLTIDDFTGQVNGVWETDANDGGAQVTEVTT